MPEIIADNISIIQSSELEGATRLDAEHYQKEYITLRSRLVLIDSVPLLNLISSNVVTGHTPSMKKESFYGGNINFIKTDNLRENQIIQDFNHSLTDTGNKQILRSSLKEKDVIVTIIGATFDIIGRACLITKEILPANINQNIALIRVNEKIFPEYLNIYLNTKFGRKYLYYLSRQTEQVNLCCREFEQLLVPLFSMNFQSQIKELLENANKLFTKSKTFYSQAEALFLKELSINDIDLSQESCYMINSVDTITAKRIDAEYYQPKYENIINTIKKYPGGFSLVKNEFVQIKDSFPKDDTKFYRYIEIGSIDISHGHIECLYLKGNELPTNAKLITNGGELIVSKVRPTRGAVTLIPVTGTSYPTVDDDDILELPVPLIKQKLQNQVGSLINESYSAYSKAKALLEEAKKKVEEMIENGAG